MGRRYKKTRSSNISPNPPALPPLIFIMLIICTLHVHRLLFHRSSAGMRPEDPRIGRAKVPMHSTLAAEGLKGARSYGSQAASWRTPKSRASVCTVKRRISSLEILYKGMLYFLSVVRAIWKFVAPDRSRRRN
jgi:hypothetical protein